MKTADEIVGQIVDGLWRLVTNKAEANRICREVALASDRLTPQIVKRKLLTRLAERVGMPDGGSLQFVKAEPRPVRIEYLDTGETEEIETILQAAIVGTVESNGIRYKSFQIWVGRVFPQWKVV